MERPQHAGHVPQGRRRPLALVEGTVGLALEVEDVPAGVGAHDLAQVVVAVGADGGPGVGQAQLVEDGQGRRHVAQRPPGLGLDVVGPRPRIARAPPEGLGQGDVHAGRRLPQPAGLAREVAAGLGRVEGGRRLREVDDGHRLGVVHAEQVAQRRQGQGPPVDRPGQEGLEEGQVVAVADSGGQGLGHPREAHPGQGGGDLDLGVGPGQQPPEQLEDEPLVVDERACSTARRRWAGPARPTSSPPPTCRRGAAPSSGSRTAS